MSCANIKYILTHKNTAPAKTRRAAQTNHRIIVYKRLNVIAFRNVYTRLPCSHLLSGGRINSCSPAVYRRTDFWRFYHQSTSIKTNFPAYVTLDRFGCFFFFLFVAKVVIAGTLGSYEGKTLENRREREMI